jgi:hypothetical protein
MLLIKSEILLTIDNENFPPLHAYIIMRGFSGYAVVSKSAGLGI